MSVYWYIGILVDRYIGIPVYQYTGLPIYRSTNLPVYQSTGLPIYQYPYHSIFQPACKVTSVIKNGYFRVAEPLLNVREFRQ